MKLSLLSGVVGVIIGIGLLFVFPDLLDISLEYTALSQKELNSSGVKGTPYALVVTTIPLLLGVVGFVVGYLLEKVIDKSS